MDERWRRVGEWEYVAENGRKHLCDETCDLDMTTTNGVVCPVSRRWKHATVTVTEFGERVDDRTEEDTGPKKRSVADDRDGRMRRAEDWLRKLLGRNADPDLLYQDVRAELDDEYEPDPTVDFEKMAWAEVKKRVVDTVTIKMFARVTRDMHDFVGDNKCDIKSVLCGLIYFIRKPKGCVLADGRVVIPPFPSLSDALPSTRLHVKEFGIEKKTTTTGVKAILHAYTLPQEPLVVSWDPYVRSRKPFLDVEIAAFRSPTHLPKRIRFA